jgi:hypothetical protein
MQSAQTYLEVVKYSLELRSSGEPDDATSILSGSVRGGWNRA